MSLFRDFDNPLVLLKRHFFSGVLVLVPFLVIAWILFSIVELIWSLNQFFPREWVPTEVLNNPGAFSLFNLILTLGMLLLLSLGISVLGWASKNYFGQKILEFIGDLINRIPVIRSVYSALDQLLKTISAGGGQQFSRVVYIEYPRKGIWTLAFVTGPAKGPAVPEHHLNVYVPTTPNPTSGFHLLVPEGEVRESHLKVEDAFKNILSLGIAQSEGGPR